MGSRGTLNKLTQVTQGVTLTDTVTTLGLQEVMRWTIPRGTAAVIPQIFNPILEFLVAAGTEMSGLTEIYVGIILPADQRRVKWLGSKYMYRAWADLSVAQQQSDEFDRATKMDLQVPYLPLGPEEIFMMGIYHATEICDPATDATHITFSIPYFERTPETIQAELAERYGFMGV